MGGFFAKIIIAIVIIVIICMCHAGNVSFPSIKSEYDDVNLSENIYSTSKDGVEDTLESVETIVDEQGESVAEKLYNGLPGFFENIFSTIDEGVQSWEYEDMDVDGVKEDSKSLLEKFLDIFPYIE